MTVKSGSSSATLTLGKTDNAVVFAKDASRPLIFTVAPTLRDDVIKPVGDFRRKDLFDFRSFTATRWSSRAAPPRRRSRRRSRRTRTARTWTYGRTPRAPRVDAMKIEDLLNKVSGLRASSFEATAPAALKTPARDDQGAASTRRWKR